MLKPLDDVKETIALISAVSKATESEVHDRLIAESTEIGSNVYAGMKSLGIPMYVTSDALDKFYRETDAFLYETTVWNCCSAKEKMREFVSSRLSQFGKKNADVFCFGDGLGFDSTDLACQGHQVKYFEPSLRCQEYAAQVFEYNGVTVSSLATLDDIEPQSLDAVVCLDVLEHVPRPYELVKQFSSWLRPNGLLFVHAPFWALHWTRSTHLKENQYLSGDLKRMYRCNGFSALDASVFWDPILLQKSDCKTGYTVSMSARLRITLGKLLLTLGRGSGFIHMWIARQIARPPADWVASLNEYRVRTDQ
jgi:SAM-dependent methyltransferase